MRTALVPTSLALAAAVGVATATDTSVATLFSPLANFRRQLADATCSLVDGVDYIGNDIASVAGAASDCCSKCSAKTGCNAFSWTNYNGGTCWLKSGKGATAAKVGAKSAVLTRTTPAPSTSAPPPSSTCSIQSNVDYVGNDIGSVYGASASDCCSKCAGRTGCGAFSWTNYNGGTCWLKSSKGATTTTTTGVYSAVVGPASSATCPTVQQGVDYVGNDIGSVAGAGASDCCTKCVGKTGCGAFTWSNHNGGTCWLKSGKGSTVNVAGVVSAVVVRGGGSNPTLEPTTTSPTPTSPEPTTPTPTSKKPSTHIMPRLRSGEIPLRSVNLGGWLVGEYWMSKESPMWKGAGDAAWSGEYPTMKKLGKEVGTAQFEKHWSTWITESDIQQIVAVGLNAVRVPVGFWIVNDINSSYSTDISRVYAPGGLKYLDKLINEWAVKYNIAVMLSLHAHQGSQNGLDHSAPQVAGQTTWSNSQANVDNSVQFATLLAARYKNSEAFLGLNLMNEPNYPTSYNVLWDFYKEAYRRIRATGNDCVIGVSPMLVEQVPPVMMNFMRFPEYYNVWHEFHVYYRWTYEKTNKQVIFDSARSYRATRLDNWSGNWIFIGEWSLTTPDEIPLNREELKQFAAVQLQQMEGAHSGWAFWSWRNDEELTRLSAWSLRQLLKEGILTIPKV